MLARRRKHRRNHVEEMEVRCLLSTITVTSLSDNETADGLVTLREAIKAANMDEAVDGSVAGNGADRIEFAANLDGGSIQLELGSLVVTSDVAIRGTDGRIEIRGNGGSRLLDVTDESPRTVLTKLRFAGGRTSESGGAVRSDAAFLKVNQSQFLDNRANESGGAIYASRLKINGATFQQNRAGSRGGAIRVEDHPENLVLKARFIRNSANFGGAIYAKRIEVSKSSFVKNSGAAVVGDGVTISQSEFAKNRGTQGAALRLYTNEADNLISDVTVRQNEVDKNRAVIFVTGPANLAKEWKTEIHNVQVVENTGIGIELGGNNSEARVELSDVSQNTDGGIKAAGQLWLADSSVDGNDVIGVQSSWATVMRTSITNNLGGILSHFGLTASNTTVAGNSRYGIHGHGLELNHATVVDNYSLAYPAVANEARITNSIVANNWTSYETRLDLGTGTSVSNSLIGVNTGTNFEPSPPGDPDENGNFVGTAEFPLDPILGVAYDNGGATLTAASSHSSPGLDSAGISDLTTDQLGRPRGQSPDMGAFEFDAAMHQAPAVVLADISRQEFQEALPFPLRITSLPAPDSELSVTFEVDPVSARLLKDYPAFDPFTLMWTSASSTYSTVTVPLAAKDGFSEPDRTLRLYASNATGQNRGIVPALGTIVDDDPFGIEATAERVEEGDSSTRTVRVSLSLTSGEFEPFEVSAATQDRSAKARKGDYQSTQGTVQFEGVAGETNVFEVIVNGDTEIEFDEYFGVLLSWPFNSEIIVPIVNDDAGAFVNGRTLSVSGTSFDDSVSVSQSNDGLTVLTNVNGVEQSFEVAAVSKTVVEVGSGNDVVDLDVETLATVHAGSGNDEVRLFGSASARVNGGEGNDSLEGGGGNDKLLGGDGNDTLFGGGADDSLFGEAGEDSIDGEAGDDRIAGGVGADTVHGGTGDDTIGGGAQSDSLLGGEGGDFILGGQGKDTIRGNDGSDSLRGNDGPDFIFAGTGAEDSVRGGKGNDWIEGEDGADKLWGDRGIDTVLGGDGDDTLYGLDINFGDEPGRASGGVGDDRIFGFTEVNGGDGNDEIGDLPAIGAIVDAGAGNDLVEGGPGSDTLRGGAGRDTIHGGAGADELRGGAESDFLGGGDDPDNLIGGGGNDVLIGGSGTDTLLGGIGDDLLSGGRGDADALALLLHWRKDSYAARVEAVEEHLGRDSGIHRYDDLSVDRLEDTNGQEYFLVRSALDLFTKEGAEGLFELLDE